MNPFIIVLFCVYLFIYPFGVLLMALDMVPVWGIGMGGFLLVLQGTIMALWLIVNYGRRGLLVALLILLLSWSIEHIGSVTGFPFGNYHYTDVLMLKLIGVVPLAIPFAWLLVVPTAVGICEWLLYEREQPNVFRYIPLSPKLIKAVGAASFAMLLDITIEPVAVHINGYWVWTCEGYYYGVPISNFIAWWVTSFLLVWLMLTICGQEKRPHLTEASAAPLLIQNRLFSWLPASLYTLNLTMFVLVNLSHNKVLAVAIGGPILIVLALLYLKPWFTRRALADSS